MNLLSKYKTKVPVVAERGEYFKNSEGEVLKVSSKMPTHDDPYLVTDDSVQKVPKRKGGVAIDAETVITASRENRNKKSKHYTEEDEALELTSKEAEAFSKEAWDLNIKVRGTISPSKLIDKAIESRASLLSKYKNKEGITNSSLSSNTDAANKAVLESLPDLNRIYDDVFELQESKRLSTENVEYAQTGLEDQKARDRAYRTIRPSDETDVKNYARWMTNTQREEWDDVVSEEAFGLYTKQNKPLKYLRASNNPNPEWDKQHKDMKMYRLHDAFEKDLKYTYFDKLKVGKQRLVNEEELKSRDFKPVNILGPNDEDSDNIMKSRARVLRQYTINKKKDDKGAEYLEYRDIYDLPEIFQSRIKGVPFGVSGRVYQEGGKTKLSNYPKMKGSRPALSTSNGKSIEVLDGRTISMDQIYDSDSVTVKGNEGKTFYKSKLKKYVK